MSVCGCGVGGCRYWGGGGGEGEGYASPLQIHSQVCKNNFENSVSNWRILICTDHLTNLTKSSQLSGMR